MATRQRTKTDQIQKAIQHAIQEVVAQRRIPAATYRLQFNADFTFNDATQLLDYLDNLGVSDLYASPIFVPRLGSTHGYDVADPTRLNDDLGSETDFDALTSALHSREMGLLLDIVPNHMGINDPRNQWWLDVLENGPSSEYASFFDIDWQPIKPELSNKVLLPILGAQYGAILEQGELRLHYTAGAFYFTYYETILPLAPHTYIQILRLALERMADDASGEDAGGDSSHDSTREPLHDPIHDGSMLNASLNLTNGALKLSPNNLARLELESIITALSYLPARTEHEPARLAERVREKAIIKRRLDTLYGESDALRAALEASIRHINGNVGDPASFDLLDELVEAQAYRLAFWRVAGEEINYRRFFDINELAAIRVEEPHVFAATHALALRLLAEGKASGLRIDHPDGLYDPVTYFCRLQQRYLYDKLRGTLDTSLEIPDAELITHIDEWLAAQAGQREVAQWPLYVVAEKILSESEPLPSEWAVFGTTGYSFLAAANGIFVDSRQEKSFTRLYNRFTHQRTPLAELTFATKMMIMRDSLAGEITTLAYELERIGERNRHYRDFTLGGIRTALREVIAALTIYRTYIDAAQGIVSPRDRKFVEAAVRAAKRRHPLLDDTLFNYIEDTLLLQNLDKFDEGDRSNIAHWVMKFQQLTGPVMAKGVEDTAFYRYNRLVALNEVGDHPAQFGLPVEHFHQDNMRRAKLWPHAMLATSTHDNKRSEDVRARLTVLSELPDLWQSALSKWSRLNAGKKREVDSHAAPDANDEYLFYQTLLGTWPLAAVTTSNAAMPDGAGAEASKDAGTPWGNLLTPEDTPEFQTFRQRIADYMLKAAKEAKVYTSWLNPYQAYEDAFVRFVERAMQPSARNRFLRDLAPLARQIAYFGHFNSLAQTLLKLTAPGLPDIYQGNELWDFSLVDPDNRRPVDYAQRAALLESLQTATPGAALAQELLATWPDGRIKLFVTHRALQLRRTHYDLFTHGDYIPLETTGTHAQHLCAYLRQDAQGARVLVVVPRLVATLTNRVERPPIGAEIWGDSAIVLPPALNEPDREQCYSNCFTDERCYAHKHTEQITAQHTDKAIIPVSELLGSFPIALLTLDQA